MKLWLRICYLLSALLFLFISIYWIYINFFELKLTGLSRDAAYTMFLPIAIAIAYLIFKLGVIKRNIFSDLSLIVVLGFTVFVFIPMISIYDLQNPDNPRNWETIAYVTTYTIYIKVIIILLTIGIITSIYQKVKSKRNIN